jgi:hypothetical protein
VKSTLPANYEVNRLKAALEAAQKKNLRMEKKTQWADKRAARYKSWGDKVEQELTKLQSSCTKEEAGSLASESSPQLMRHKRRDAALHP